MQTRFLHNLKKIANATQQNDVHFLPILQQMCSRREAAQTLTYSQEVDRIRKKLEAGNRVLIAELQLVLHGDINDALRRWLLDENIPFLDFIDILDNDRQELVSWVHLSAKGNQILANALSQKILEHACGKEPQKIPMPPEGNYGENNQTAGEKPWH